MSETGTSPDPRTGSHDLTLEDRLDAVLVDLRDDAGNERHVQQLEDIVSEAIKSKDVTALLFVYFHGRPAPDRQRHVNDGLYLAHHATEVALRGVLDKPSEEEYEQIARMAAGFQVELEPGGGSFAAVTIRPLIDGLEAEGAIRMDDDFGYELTGLGKAHVELWIRHFPEVIERIRTNLAGEASNTVRPKELGKTVLSLSPRT